MDRLLNEEKEIIIRKILLSIFFIAIFINFLGPIFDPDFPFHIKTGEYIYLHREIPTDDPFSINGDGAVTERERFTLSQYWLTQIIFYKIYSIFGPPGIILLRATIFSVFLLLLWTSMRKRGFYSSLVIISIVSLMLKQYSTDRPQYFSFFFSLVMVLLIERFRERPDSSIPLFFIPPLMLVWANMHAGFVFGIAIILIYTLAETIKILVNSPGHIGKPLEKQKTLIFFLVALTAVLFSYLNPDKNGQILMALESHTEAKWLYETNKDYLTPIQAIGFPLLNKTAFIAFLIIFGFVSIVVAFKIIRTKSIDMSVLSICVFSSIAAFTAIRYIPFFIATALPLAGNYKFFEGVNLNKHLRYSFIASIMFLIFCISAISYGFRDYHNMFKLGQETDYPEKAANFLLDNRIKANMFNQFNKGSYFIWRLYPYYRVFNDTRYINLESVRDSDAISYALDSYEEPTNLAIANTLSNIVSDETGEVFVSSNEYPNKKSNMKPLWNKLLDMYNIDLVVHEACVDFTKELYPLPLRLIKDNNWRLIYADGTILIFIRNKEKYSDIISKYNLSENTVFDEIILESAPYVKSRISVSTPYSSLAFALLMKGRDADAKKMIEAALELDPNDIVANFTKAYMSLKK